MPSQALELDCLINSHDRSQCADEQAYGNGVWPICPMVLVRVHVMRKLGGFARLEDAEYDRADNCAQKLRYGSENVQDPEIDTGSFDAAARCRLPATMYSRSGILVHGREQAAKLNISASTAIAMGVSGGRVVGLAAELVDLYAKKCGRCPDGNSPRTTVLASAFRNHADYMKSGHRQYLQGA